MASQEWMNSHSRADSICQVCKLTSGSTMFYILSVMVPVSTWSYSTYFRLWFLFPHMISHRKRFPKTWIAGGSWHNMRRAHKTTPCWSRAYACLGRSHDVGGKLAAWRQGVAGQGLRCCERCVDSNWFLLMITDVQIRNTYIFVIWPDKIM